MTVGAILTLGLGAYSDVNHVVTLGYGTGATPTPTTTAARGGDDVPRRRKSPHKGFDLEAWKAKQPDFEGTIRGAYEHLMYGPSAEAALDIVAPHKEEQEIDWPALLADRQAISSSCSSTKPGCWRRRRLCPS
jgi:hypothetical protein